MQKHVFILLVLLLSPFYLFSQNVETLVQGYSGGNIIVDKNNNLILSDFLGSCGCFNCCAPTGHVVRRISPNGDLDTLVNWDYTAGPTGLAIDSKNNLYVSQYSLNRVVKVTPNGETSIALSNVNGPTGLVVDDEDNVFVALGGWNNPPSQPGIHIYKIDTTGNSSIFVTNRNFNGANGFVRDSKGNFYISNWFSGVIHKITPEGTLTELVVLPGEATGWMTISNDVLYVTARGVHQISKVTLEGEVSILAGSTIGYEDGNLLESRFISPNGIAVSNDGSRIYVTETEARRIRVINLESVTDVKEKVGNLPENFYLKHNYPNPFNPVTTIEYSLNRSNSGLNIKLEVIDSVGKLIETLVDDFQLPGNYKYSFDGEKLASGAYFYKLTAGNYSESKKMLLLK